MVPYHLRILHGDRNRVAGQIWSSILRYDPGAPDSVREAVSAIAGRAGVFVVLERGEPGASYSIECNPSFTIETIRADYESPARQHCNGAGQYAKLYDKRGEVCVFGFARAGEIRHGLRDSAVQLVRQIIQTERGSLPSYRVLSAA